MKTSKSNKIIRIISIILLYLTGINALAAGYSFIVEPGGQGLNINVDYLMYSPFSNFFIPGLILFTVIGIGCVIVASLAILKKPNYAIYILFQGFIILGWIVIQVLMLRMFHTLHLIIFTIGLGLIISGFILPRNEKA